MVLWDPALDVLARTPVLTALSEAPQGVLVIGRDSTVLWCNQAGADVLRYDTAAEIIGRPLYQVSVAAMDPEAWEVRWQRLLEGESWTGEVTTYLADGELGRLRVARFPLRGEDGSVIGVMSLASDATEELAAKEALERSEEKLSALLQYSSDVAVVFERSGVMRYVSPSVEQVAGWRPEELHGRLAWELVHPDDLDSLMRATADLTPGATVRGEWRMRRRDGTYAWFEQTLSDLSHVPAIEGIIGNFRDVTERHEAEAARRDSELFLRHVVDTVSDAYLGVDGAGVLTDWNPAAERIFEWSAEEAVGADLASLILPVTDRPAFRKAFAQVMSGGGRRFLEQPFEMVGVSRSGRVFPVEVSVVQLTVGERPHFRAFIRDISVRKEAEARLTRQALTDSLTSLPNRTLIRDRLAQALSRQARRGGTVAVLFLDIDRFKLVNDGLGHSAGDELLIAVASRLRGTVRSTDTVGRYGGDEFVVVAEEAGSQEEINALAARLLESISSPLLVGGRIVHVQASVGIAVVKDGAADPDDVIRDADLAMYRAKEDGGQRVQIFESAMESHAVVRFELERDLASAIEASLDPTADAEEAAGRLCVYYQPIVTFEGHMDSLEALVRWEHPKRGLIAPLEFIPLAEEAGLISGVGRFVLRQAAEQLRAWQEAGHGDLAVSVNVSARELDGDALTRDVDRVLRATGIEPRALCLELTESAFLRDGLRAARTLEELCRLGVRIVVDDFGTGYSSLAYLQRFPVHAVKLDRSFVSGVLENPQDAAIVSAVINLAHSLGIDAIAEGIETEAQRRALAELGCELAQGFLWSPPRPPSDIEILLAHRRTSFSELAD